MKIPNNKNGFKLEPIIYDYSDGFCQYQMIKDWHRTKSYFNEIRKYVKNKRVIDFGAGSGILGVYAALCGAEYVCFVEIQEKMHNVIRKMCELNDIDNFSIKKYYQECEGDKFDVCISELIGSYHFEAGLEEGLKVYSKIIRDNKNCIAIPESLSLYVYQTYNEEIEKEKKYLENFEDVKLNKDDFINSIFLRTTAQKSIFKKIGKNIFLKNLKFKDFSENQTNIFKKIILQKDYNSLNIGWEAYVGNNVFLDHFLENDNDYCSWLYAFLCVDGDDAEYDFEMNMYSVNIKKANNYNYRINFI